MIFKFLFDFRVQRRLFPFNGVLFTQEIPNEIIPLCMDHDAVLRLEKKVISRLNFKVLVFCTSF